VKAERTWFLGEGEEALAKERSHGSFTRQVQSRNPCLPGLA
jgi:hypothetical protein